MTEAEARELANEITQHPGWTAYAEERSVVNREAGWWVKAHHDAMRPSVRMSPYPMLPISSRDEWDAARAKWGN